MNLTSDTIKQGTSNVGDFTMLYTITYDSSNKVKKIEAQVKKQISGNAAGLHCGFASYNPPRYALQLTSEISQEERKTLIEDFENTITELSK